MNKRHYHLGPGRVEGVWYWLRRAKDKPALVGYRVSIYVDNGYGTHGYVPVTGKLVLQRYEVGDGDPDRIEDFVVADADEQVDDLIYGGGIEKFLPSYHVTEGGPF